MCQIVEIALIVSVISPLLPRVRFVVAPVGPVHGGQWCNSWPWSVLGGLVGPVPGGPVGPVHGGPVGPVHGGRQWLKGWEEGGGISVGRTEAGNRRQRTETLGLSGHRNIAEKQKKNTRGMSVAEIGSG